MSSVALALVPWLALAAPPPPGPPVATGFLFKEVLVAEKKFAYCVYVPPEYAADQRWPVILFLHGSGQCGTDGLSQTEIGLPRIARKRRARCPAIVVMPQCPPGAAWEGDMARMALRCLEQTSTEYNLDPHRVYLTGLSLGGAGCWLIGAAVPDRFAAIVPVCGFGDVALAPKLASTPVWCFHGELDERVPVDRSREMVAALRAAGGKVEYTELPSARHDIWDRVYDDPALWRWLLAQRREKLPGDPP